ncbi:family 2 glycosyl transferase [Paenibacillus selenitireducens]|uniref:Glucosyl-3-phosphoglycerate synthase n=1 Tax=Paenibacillus selenitireducens TaxID=1324314 RepID=A0A1T2XLC6_9BACL|nr:family 2 glycosyl transferase [Paenibacillus selenitireducens]
MSVILSAQNEEDSIGAVLSEVSRLPIQEIIIVLNGCTDGTYGIARTYPLAKIIHYPDPIGHDVGRAIGAKMASSDILLFVDADIPITAQDLMPFVQAIHQGVDVALNDINPYLSTFDRRDDLSRCKEFLNRSLGRRDLTVNSLTAIPHALSRKAMETIGYTYLMVPPKAQAIAILKGLRVEVCTSVNVVERNKIRKTNVGQTNPVAELIIGDHLEAIREAMDICGSRLALTDNQRNHIAARRNRR